MDNSGTTDFQKVQDALSGDVLPPQGKIYWSEQYRCWKAYWQGQYVKGSNARLASHEEDDARAIRHAYDVLKAAHPEAFAD